VAANDHKFWPRDVDRRIPQRTHIVRGLLFVIALGIIAAIVFRVEGRDKPSEAKDADVARLGMPPCLASLRQSGWRHSDDQLEALCAR
jgi:hypothetical protein